MLGAAAPAAASRGSVPVEVTAYLADGLEAQLVDLYGRDAAGGGIEFDDSTMASDTTRVFEFTADYLAGAETETPVRRLNEWVAIVSVAEEVVGVATVIIPADRELPELSLFAPEPALAAALAGLPAEAALVRDSPNAAWYSLVDDRLTAIEPGDSGLDGSISLAGFAAALSYPQSAVPQRADIVPGVIIGAVTLLAGLVAVAMLLLVARRRRAAVDAAADADPAPDPDPETTPAPEPEKKPGANKPAAEKPPAKTPAKPAAAKPAAKKPASK